MKWLIDNDREIDLKRKDQVVERECVNVHSKTDEESRKTDGIMGLEYTV